MTAGAFIFVGGFFRVTALEITEAQLFLGLGVLFILVLQLWILWALINLTRRWGQLGSFSRFERH